jgi:4-oxalomesaconate tautomerase
MSQISVPCVMMRGGTSRGPYFLKSDLPADQGELDRFLLAAMGSPDARQIDGIGGATTLTSKVAIISPADQDDVQVDYLFAQVSLDEAFVDYAPSCGNMLAGVGPYAIEQGLVPASDGETRVMIRNVNTNSRIEAVIQTPGGKVTYEGDARIDGVPGTAAPVVLNFMDVVGSKTGKLFPTGNPKDVIGGIEVTCIDVAMPMVITTAAAMGKTGYESREELDADPDFFRRLEDIRLEAGQRMGMGNVSGKVIPKFGIIAAPRDGGSIASRYFVPTQTHAAYAVTGSICLGSCCVIPGTVAEGIADVKRVPIETIVIEHPTGKIETVLEVDRSGGGFDLLKAGTLRTTRRLFAGEIYAPARKVAGAA